MSVRATASSTRCSSSGFSSERKAAHSSARPALPLTILPGDEGAGGQVAVALSIGGLYPARRTTVNADSLAQLIVTERNSESHVVERLRLGGYSDGMEILRRSDGAEFRIGHAVT